MKKEEIKKFINDVLTIGSQNTTYFHIFATDEEKQWGLVAAYMDYNETGNPEPYIKLSYLPNNTLMGEYDIDWIMPYDEETGIVDDTEISLDDNELTIDWIYEQINRFKNEYIGV